MFLILNSHSSMKSNFFIDKSVVNHKLHKSLLLDRFNNQ